jgi:hypothetical protein
MFSARHEFPDEWHRFLYPLDVVDDLALALDLGQARFPFPFRSTARTPETNQIHLTSFDLVLSLKDAVPYTNASPGGLRLRVRRGLVEVASAELASANGQPPRALGVSIGANAEPGAWGLTVAGSDLAMLAQHNPALCRVVAVDGVDRLRLEPKAIDDVLIVCHYTVN